MRTNAELYDLYMEPDIVTAIEQGRIRWAGHVQRTVSYTHLDVYKRQSYFRGMFNTQRVSNLIFYTINLFQYTFQLKKRIYDR